MSTPPACRIWLFDDRPGPQTRLFRRALEVRGRVVNANLELFAERRYLLWVNGVFIAAGPAAHHPEIAPFDVHDLTARLRPGRNVLAVLVHTDAMGVHQHVPTAAPGLTARLTWSDDAGEHAVETDDAWRATDRTGWAWSTPKRGWALPPIERFRMADASPGWQRAEYDDRAWSAPSVHAFGAGVSGGLTAVRRPTPMLRSRPVTPTRVVRCDAVREPVVGINAGDGTGMLGESIVGLTREPADGVLSRANQGFVIRGLTASRGVAVDLDLGAFYVGQPRLAVACPSAGTIDVAWSEQAVDGIAVCVRKGVSYVDRIEAERGELEWRPINFTGMRFLTLVFRGFTGDVAVTHVAFEATEPDLDWAASFTCNDDRLNAIWDVCARTIRVGTQDALMDCPTREQATYVGDGLPVAKWIARLTGDTRFWRDLVVEQFRRQAANGLIKGTPYSAFDGTLLDYVLIAVIGTRDYLSWTGDRATFGDVLPAARRAIGWFDTHRDADGWLSWRWPGDAQRDVEHVFDPARPRIESSINLFIDHPGLGWHNPDDAGIDRRGINAAIHVLLVMAREALADIEDTLGDRQRAFAQRAEADRLRRAIIERLFDPRLGVFVDGELDGRRLDQISEQANTWAILAGCLSREDAADTLDRLLSRDDSAIARSGYYFWIYQLRALSSVGRTDLALRWIERLWGRVIDSGSTTVWETPAGDDLDSYCHPWSAAPASYLLTDVLGLGGLETDDKVIRPRYDLLSEASGSMFTRDGRCAIHWRRDDDGGVIIEGELPSGVRATVQSVDGNHSTAIDNVWRWRFA
ncbi:MAG: hypothetical protein AAFY08_05845 [Planctomycetota bacterium]